MDKRSVQLGILAMASVVLLSCQPQGQNHRAAILTPGREYWFWWVGGRDDDPDARTVVEIDQNGWIKMRWYGVEAWVNPDLIAAVTTPISVRDQP